MRKSKTRRWMGLACIGLVLILVTMAVSVGPRRQESGLWLDSTPAGSTVELFIMPDCPYGQDALRELLSLVHDMRGHLTLKVRFIAHPSNRQATLPIMQFVSLHGSPEVLKGLVAVTIERLYPSKYLAYLTTTSDEPAMGWEACADQAGVDREVVAAYLVTPAAASWFMENIQIGAERGVSRSPTIYINGQLYGRAADRDRLRLAICRSDTRDVAAGAGCLDLPECLDDDDCAAEAGGTPICENRKCVSVREPVVKLSVLSSRLIAYEHLEPTLTQLARRFPSMQTAVAYVEEEEGQQLGKRIGARCIPSFLADHSVRRCHNYRWLIRAGAVPLENGDVIVRGSLEQAPFTSYGDLSERDGRIVYEFPAKDRASALHAQGLLERAERLYEDIVAEGGGDAEVYTNLGSLYGEQGQMERAMQAYRYAIAMDPDCVGAYRNLRTLCDKMSLPEGQQYALLQEGWTWCRRDAWLEAASKFREVLALNSDIPSAHLGLGLACLRIGRVEEALALLAVANRESPDNPRVLNLLGGAHWRMEHHDEAIRLYRQALALAPGDEQIRLNVANALHTVGKLNAALQVVEDGKDKGEDGLRAKRMELYYLLGRYEEARNAAAAWEAEGNAAVEMLYWASQADLAAGRLDVARERLLRCLARSGSDPGVSLRLGEAFLDCQMINHAEESFRKAVAVLPGHAVAHGYLSELYARQRSPDVAAADDHGELAMQFGLTAEQRGGIAEKVARAMHACSQQPLPVPATPRASRLDR